MKQERFNTYGFMAWLKEEFPECVDTSWNYDLVENLIDYVLENEESMYMFTRRLYDILPEVTISEIERFVY